MPTPRPVGNAIDQGAEDRAVPHRACSWAKGGGRGPDGNLRRLEADEQAAYDTLLPLQRDDVGIFQAMDNKPVTVQLLDPPLRSSCPTESGWPWPSPWPRSGARRRSRSAQMKAMDLEPEPRRCWPRSTRPARGQPDAGAAGVRLGILKPGLYHAGRAILEAAARVKADSGNPIVEIMIPLAATREAVPDARGVGAGGPPDPRRPRASGSRCCGGRWSSCPGRPRGRG